MKKLICLFTACVFLISSIEAQEKFADILGGNNIEANICSNGRAISSLRNTSLPDSDALLSTLRSSGLWLTALTNNEMTGSIQIANENGNADFQTDEEFQGIWKINRTEILSHIQDFDDNGQIDNPIPALFDWVPSQTEDLAGGAAYWDNDQSGAYEAESGDYPLAIVRGCAEPIIPEQMVWSSFNDRLEHTESDFESMNLTIRQSAFAFECSDSEVLNNTIFVAYHVVNRNIFPLTNIRIGFYNDFSIGCDGDDFVGSIPERNIQYAYNSTATDCDGGYEGNPPVHAMQVVRRPFRLITNPDTLVEANTEFFLPLGHEESGIEMPQSTMDYWNIMNGRLLDGTTIENDGVLFSGDPTNPNEISERSENNIAGNRRTVSVLEPIAMGPGQVQEFIVAHTIYGGGSMTTDEALQLLQSNTEVQDAMDNCVEDFCSQSVTVSTKSRAISKIKIFPNPVSDRIFIEHEQAIDNVSMYNLLGQSVPVSWDNTSVDVQGLAAGPYFVEIVSNGERYVEKIFVAE